MLPTVSFVGVSSPIQPTVSSTRARLPLLNEWERRVANAQKPRALLCCCYTKHALGRARRASAVSHHDFHADKMLFKKFSGPPYHWDSISILQRTRIRVASKMPLKKINFRTLIVLTARWQCQQQASVGKHAARFGPSGRLWLSRPFLWPGSTGTRHQDEPPPPPLLLLLRGVTTTRHTKPR